MNRRITRGLLLFSMIVLLFGGSLTAVVAQDIQPEAIISGSLLQGTWYEQWNQGGTLYCPNNGSRYITTTSESFTLSAPATEEVLSIAYQTSRVNVTLARSSGGSYVYTNTRSWYVHLMEVTRVSATQMNVVSRFYALDGSCTLTNSAIWTYTGSPQPTPPPPGSMCVARPLSVAVNKRMGPGLNYMILGQLLPGTSATVIGSSYDAQGRLWWQLADYTWVSSVVTVAQGNCPT